MRTNRIFAIAAACVALAACTKEPVLSEGSFVKGQKVTLTVTAGIPETKVTSELNADDGKTVDFAWEEGDSIKVTVGEGAEAQSSTFKLKTGYGNKTATFEGVMPADGGAFTVQYPYTTPDLSNQTYSKTEAIPHDKMLLIGTDCCIDKAFSLVPNYSALRLNFYGLDRKITQIQAYFQDVNDTDSDPIVCILDCNSSQKIGVSKSDSVSFFVAIPGGTYYFALLVESDAVEPLVDINSTADYVDNGNHGKGIVVINDYFYIDHEIAFSPGYIINMPARPISMVWAPVNCGYDAGHPNGLYYQFGRKYGQTPVSFTVQPMTMDEGQDPANKDILGERYSISVGSETMENWFSGNPIDDLWNAGSEFAPVKTSYDPCPEGWRVPTLNEIDMLLYSSGGPRGSWDSIKSGWNFDDLFLPAVGYIRSDFDYIFYRSGAEGCYLSSYISESGSIFKTNCLSFCDPDNTLGGPETSVLSSPYHADAYTVRCVLE